MTEHTPTPWQVGPDNVNPFYIAAPDHGMTAFVGVVPIPMQTGRDEAENRANAAFIVKAVNSHDALVKALTELRNEVSGWLSTYDPDLRQAMGNTNVAVMQDRVANAIAALASIKERP